MVTAKPKNESFRFAFIYETWIEYFRPLHTVASHNIMQCTFNTFILNPLDVVVINSKGEIIPSTSCIVAYNKWRVEICDGPWK